jgi:hypothetical protein
MLPAVVLADWMLGREGCRPMQTPALISTACGPTCRSVCASQSLPGACTQRNAASGARAREESGRVAVVCPPSRFYGLRLLARSGIVARRPSAAALSCPASGSAVRAQPDGYPPTPPPLDSSGHSGAPNEPDRCCYRR